MIEAKIDMRELGRTVKDWAKEFGDTNDQMLFRLSAEVCRQLSIKVQPYGVSPKTKRKIEKAIFSDAARCLVSIMDAEMWRNIQAGKQRSIKHSKAGSIKIRQANVLNSADEVNRFIERKRQRGKVPDVPYSDRGVCWHADATTVFKKRAKLAGIAKGTWIMAGREISRRAKKKGLGIGAKYGEWAVQAALASGARGDTSHAKRKFTPEMKINSTARHMRSSRVLKGQDIKNSVNLAYKKTIRYYASAVSAIDKRAKSR